jgi:hypothetical protein
MIGGTIRSRLGEYRGCLPRTRRRMSTSRTTSAKIYEDRATKAAADRKALGS